MKTFYTLLYGCLAFVAWPLNAPFIQSTSLATQTASACVGNKPPAEKIATNFIISAVTADTSGVLALVGVDNKYGFIDKAGHEVVPVQYESIGQDFFDGRVAVKRSGKWGFADKSGREVVPVVYDNAADFCEGLALVNMRGKYGYIDTAGRVVVPIRYDGAGSFHEGRAMVLLQGKRGFIDKNGNAVIPLKYDYVFDFSTAGHQHP